MFYAFPHTFPNTLPFTDELGKWQSEYLETTILEDNQIHIFKINRENGVRYSYGVVSLIEVNDPPPLTVYEYSTFEDWE
jgi:hypothetical protein